MRTGPDGGVSETSTERRVEELLDRMTVAEKAAQLGSVNADRILNEDGKLDEDAVDVESTAAFEVTATKEVPTSGRTYFTETRVADDA